MREVATPAGRVVEDGAALVARRMDVVVGGGDVPALGVELARQVLAEPLPLVVAVAGHGQPPVPAVAVGRQAGHLEGDVAVGVAADEAVRRHEPVHGPLEEVGAALGLGELEAALVGGGARLLHHRPNRVGDAVLEVLVEDRAVPAELQHDRLRVPPPDGYLLLDDAQRLPAFLPPDHVGLVGVQLLDVDVDHVGAREGEAPRHARVAAGVDPRERRLAAPDDIPAGGVQVHEVAQGGHLDAPVGVVGEYRDPGRRPRAGHHPVVAALGGDDAGQDPRRLRIPRADEAAVRLDDLQGGQPPRRERVAVAGPHRVEDVLGDDGDVEAVGHREVVPGVGGEAPVRLLGPVAGHVQGELHLVDGVPPHARHPEGGPAQHRGLRRPRLGLDPGELELHRQVVAVLLDERVDAGGVGGEEAVGVGVVAGPLGLVERPPEHHQPGAPVVVEGLGTEDLGEPPLAPAAPHLHLPQPVLGHDVALREEQVVVVLRVDVGHPPLVADHLDRRLQAGHGELAVDGGEGALGEGVEGLRLLGTGVAHDRCRQHQGRQRRHPASAAAHPCETSECPSDGNMHQSHQ